MSQLLPFIHLLFYSQFIAICLDCRGISVTSEHSANDRMLGHFSKLISPTAIGIVLNAPPLSVIGSRATRISNLLQRDFRT